MLSLYQVFGNEESFSRREIDKPFHVVAVRGAHLDSPHEPFRHSEEP